jgi:hypothetical protein
LPRKEVIEMVTIPLTPLERERMDRDTILRRYPRLVAHLICESLGYFTPGAAANAIRAYREGETFPCEWYVHMAQGFDWAKLLEVGKKVIGRAFQYRRLHRGYMADYRLARKLVEAELQGHGPIFASWF